MHHSVTHTQKKALSCGTSERGVTVKSRGWLRVFTFTIPLLSCSSSPPPCHFSAIVAVLSIVVRGFKAPGITRLAKRRKKGWAVKFSGLSQKAADFSVFLGQVSAKSARSLWLRHMGKCEQIEDHCLKGGEGVVRQRAACISALKFRGKTIH